jgi:hypothetical protein
MQILYGYLKKHWHLDFQFNYYASVITFWIAVLLINYWVFPYVLGFNMTIERYLTETFFFSESRWNGFAFMAFYAFPYFSTLLLGHFFYKETSNTATFASFLNNKAVWQRALFAMACMAFGGASHSYISLSQYFSAAPEQYFARKLFSTFTSYFYIGLPLFLVWYFYDRKNTTSSPTNFYGLTLRNWYWQPYIQLASLVVVGVSIAAVLLPQLTEYYPTLKVQQMGAFNLMPLNMAFGIYEFVYGCFYTWAEVLMRGFLVIGMTHLLGRRAIMPMVSMYLFFHLAKPPAEAISSLLGGYILGVIAYESRNITGGVLLHATVAVSMDLAARIILG